MERGCSCIGAEIATAAGSFRSRPSTSGGKRVRTCSGKRVGSASKTRAMAPWGRAPEPASVERCANVTGICMFGSVWRAPFGMPRWTTVARPLDKSKTLLYHHNSSPQSLSLGRGPQQQEHRSCRPLRATPGAPPLPLPPPPPLLPPPPPAACRRAPKGVGKIDRFVVAWSEERGRGWPL